MSKRRSPKSRDAQWDGIASDYAANANTGPTIDKLIGLTHGALKTYNEMFINRSLCDSLKTALKYANGGSELIASSVQMKVDFYGAGFRVKVTPVRKTSVESLKSRVDDFIHEHNLQQIANDLIFDYSATDNCILHWVVRKNVIEWITTLPPDEVEFQDGPNPKLFRLLTPALCQEIRDNEKEWPEKYVKAAKMGPPKVELKDEDGEYWIVKTRGRKFCGLCRPTMEAVYADIQLREMLVAGDWSVAYFIKNLITLVKMGESITHGPRAGTKDLYPKKAEIEAVQAEFKKIGTTLRLYGNHTLSVEYIAPDPKIISSEKYENVEKRIGRWTGTPEVMMTGEGDGFSQGILGKKRFEAIGERAREAVSWIMVELFQHESVMSELKLPADLIIKCTWNKQILKDPKQILDEAKFLNESGAADVETLHENFGWDHNEVLTRKEADNKNKEIWKPVFEKSQGLLSNEGGAPKKKDGNEPNPPRASKGQS